MTERVDAVVIGAGAVGLAVGRALARAGSEVIVAEAQPGIGQGVSSRNSEVIHAGIYYAPGSLKARLCVQGRELLYEFCESHGVPHQRCGKFIVATREAERGSLEVIRQRAEANGVELQGLDGEEAMRIEPALRCVAALSSPATGIIDSHSYMLALQGGVERHGGVVALGSAVDSARLSTAEGHLLRFADGSELACRWLVNSASLHAPALARRFEGLDPAHVPQSFFSKGNYYSLAGRAPFSRLVYPAPSDAWLGVHLTLDLGGQARFGPDQEWLDAERPEAIDYRVDPRRADGFYEEVRRYWPGLPDGALQPAYSGVRPKIHGPADKAPDFRIDGPALHGVEGLVNLFGIESPGLTSSLAIADEVLRLLANPA